MRATYVLQKLLICMALLLSGCGTIAEAPVMPLTAVPSTLDEKAPYLYYYSDVYHAFVVERADGTDGFSLGGGLMPDDTWLPSHYGWSPSGEWFTWMAKTTTDCDYLCRNSKGLYAVRNDNSQPKVLLQLPTEENNAPYNEVYLFAWSPVNSNQVLAVYEQNSQMLLAVWDMDHDRPILTYLIEEPLLFQGSNAGLVSDSVRWLPDGKSIAYDYRFEYKEDGDYLSGSMTREVGLDGSTTTFEPPAFTAADGQQLFMRYARSKSAYEYSVYHPGSGKTTLIQDLARDPAAAAELSSNVPAELAASPDHRYLLMTLRNRQGAIEQAWLLSFDDATLTPINLEVLLDEPSLYTLHTLWTPDSRTLMLVADHKIYQFDVAQMVLTEVGSLPIVDSKNEAYIDSLQWTNSYLAIGLWGDLTLWNHRTREIEHYGESGRTYRLSPDSHYLVTGQECDPTEYHESSFYCVIDLNSGRHWQGIPMTLRQGWVVETSWHPTSPWLLLGNYNLDTTSAAVARFDSGIYRELPPDALWLPEQVHLKPADTVEQPLYPAPLDYCTTPDADYVISTVTWSADGQRIAGLAYARARGEHPMTILVWNAATCELDDLLPFAAPMELPAGDTINAFALDWDNDNQLRYTFDTYARRTQCHIDLVTRLPECDDTPIAEDSSLWHDISRDGSLTALLVEDEVVPVNHHLEVYISPGNELIFSREAGWIPIYGNRIRISPDNQFVAFSLTRGQRTLAVNHILSTEEIFAAAYYAQDIAWSPDSQYLATAGAAGVYIWEMPE